MAPDLLSLLRGIDLRTPWFAPWAPWIAPVVQQVLSGRSVAEALNRTQDDLGLQSAVPVRFVAQAELPAGEAYEAYIARTQTVPTRDHVHDLLNGVCWLRFPATKRRLNHWQGEQIAQQGVGATRGPLRDSLTLFDENAALWSAPVELTQALAERDWQALFVRHRQLWTHARVVLFGHALLEKLIQPYKAITAHVWVMPPSCPPTDAAWDAHLAQQLAPDTLVPKPYVPLPILGIPGWHPEQHDPAYYEDRQVFRR